VADVLVVGAGPGGSACAETLRAEGFTGSIALVGREPDPPYDRPPASKEYLRGETSRDKHFLYEPSFWGAKDIELWTRTSVMKLDTGARTATFADKQTVSYRQLLLATGSLVRRLRVEGGALEGIHYLRALGNADAIRRDAQGASKAVLVGGSFIACEVAASLTTMGVACTLVMMEAAPMANAFGDQAGEHFARVLREHGVEVHAGETLAGFEGTERVSRVLCESGAAFDADLVVMGTGAVPDVTLARSAGVEIGETGGVACSAELRTSAPDVWAAGDICEFDSVLFDRRTRIEHWEVARSQGAFAARGMMGAPGPWDEIPYFWSDLADWTSLEYVGSARGWDREIVRGSIDDGEFTVFYVEGERVTAAMTVGRGGDLDQARELIVSRDRVDDVGLDR
jgi:3-phenylpropionate/trans-cinnamate dioxygenase ferredoxin reductase component